MVFVAYLLGAAVFVLLSSWVLQGVLCFKQKTAYEIVDCDWSSDVCSSDLSGFSLLRLAADECEVLSLAVAPDRRGSGGGALDRKSVV